MFWQVLLDQQVMAQIAVTNVGVVAIAAEIWCVGQVNSYVME